jgi:hypothetical protein
MRKRTNETDCAVGKGICHELQSRGDLTKYGRKKGPLIYDGPWETLGMVLLAFLKDKQARL